MKFEDLLQYTYQCAFFDLSTLAQLSGESKRYLSLQLHRWVQSGKIIALKRGLYMVSEQYRKQPLNSAYLANHLLTPSYLSCAWALSYYGMIPEMTVTHTSVTPRKTCQYINAVGRFKYQHIKQSLFFGYRSIQLLNVPVYIASPEKALLDLWYFETQEWSLARLKAMRFQSLTLITLEQLKQDACRFESPRIQRALVAWEQMVEEITLGEEIE